MRYTILQLLAGLAQALAGAITVILSPERRMTTYLLFGLLCLVKVLVNCAISLDLMLNLVTSRADTQRFLASVLGMSEDSWLGRKVLLGRGAYIPFSAEQLLAEFFYGFPQGTFMCSYNWDHAALPRRIARDLLPEKPRPRKCWLDVEQLIPGTLVTPACEAAVRAARVVFAFPTPKYMRSTNCQASEQ